MTFKITAGQRYKVINGRYTGFTFIPENSITTQRKYDYVYGDLVGYGRTVLAVSKLTLPQPKFHHHALTDFFKK